MSASVRGDQVTVGEANYTGASVVTLAGGRLHFRGPDGSRHTAWINQIDLLIIDRGGAFADFNQAERYLADGEPAKAIVRYRRMLRLSEEFWSELVAARLVIACDRAGRLDEATLDFIRVVRGERSGPAAAARLMPQVIPGRRNARVVRAVQHLDAAIAANPTYEQRAVLELLRYQILVHSGDKRAAEAERAVAELEIPSSLQCEQVYSIQLEALTRASGDLGPTAALDSLDRAIRDCPTTLVPSFLLLKGRVLLRAASTPEEVIRASWPFMRVVIHMPDDPRAADGLYETARAIERIGLGKQAVELLGECLAHPRVGDETRQLAQAALDRMGAAGATPG